MSIKLATVSPDFNLTSFPSEKAKQMSVQISDEAKKKLEKQRYRIVGSHSAVKVCGWTKKMINGQGGCYKLKFYGIMSNQCMQMTPSLSCANRCTFCWRDYKAPVSKKWEWMMDEPDEIFEGSVKAHHKLLEGHNKHPKTNQIQYEKSKKIKHVALSLTGEPINYPKINELIKKFNQEGISTFLVTNAQFPEEIKNLNPVTQLYISLDAPDKLMLKNIDVPLFEDYWERFNRSLKYLSQKKQRTCLRLTMIKGLNMSHQNEYAKMIKKGNPDFIEVKGYMHVGASIYRLKRENMPSHDEIKKFAKELLEFLPEYGFVSEHKPSFVVCLAKKKFFVSGKWHTWIDFNKYNELVNNPLTKDDFTTEDYLAKTPEVLVGER